MKEEKYKQFEYPDHVNFISEKLDVHIKDMIIKNVILSNIDKDKNEFKISKFMQYLSNRVSTLPSYKEVINAFIIFTEMYPHWKKGIFDIKK